MPEIKTVIVGAKFRGPGAVTATAGLAEGDDIELRREPKNQYDANACACYFRGEHIGYIPAKQNGDIARALDGSHAVTAVVADAAIMIGGGIKEVPRIIVRF
jgi:hypothetical protein